MSNSDEVQRAKDQAKAILEQLRPMLEVQHEMETVLCDGEWSEYRLARRFFQETGINPVEQDDISAIDFSGFIRDIVDDTETPAEPVQLAGARKAIITAMLEAEAVDEDRAMSRDAILDAAGYPGGKEAFQALKDQRLIAGKRGVGSWLSAAGVAAAERNGQSTG